MLTRTKNDFYKFPHSVQHPTLFQAAEGLFGLTMQLIQPPLLTKDKQSSFDQRLNQITDWVKQNVCSKGNLHINLNALQY